MARSAGKSLEYRLAVWVSLGLLVFSLVSGAVRFYMDYQAQIEAAGRLQRQLVQTLQAQAEVAAFAGNAEIANDVLRGLLTNDTIAQARLSASNGFSQTQQRNDIATAAQATTRYVLRSPVDQQSVIGALEVSSNQAVVRAQAIRSALAQALLSVLQIVMTALLLALTFRRIVGRPVASLARRLKSIEPGGSQRLSISPLHQNDAIGMLSASANSLLDAAQNALNDERELRRKVEQLEQHYRRIFETTNVGIMVLRADGSLINSNPILIQKIVGIHFNGQYTPGSEDFVSAIFAQPELAWAMIQEASTHGQAVAADLQLKTESGAIRWAHCILSVSHDRAGQMELIEGVLYDVTTRREQEDAARRRAELDTLTGIHNRHGSTLFLDRSLRHAAEDQLEVGVLMLDLDGFKHVNDTHGHAAGDEALIEVARRLRQCVHRATDLVGRLGGDEFVAVAYHCGEGQTLLAQMAGSIVSALSRPILLTKGVEVQVGASVGIARYPQDGSTTEALLHSADLALYQVKHQGKNGFAFAQQVRPTDTSSAKAA